jgi:hypothetical protein
VAVKNDVAVAPRNVAALRNVAVAVAVKNEKPQPRNEEHQPRNVVELRNEKHQPRNVAALRNEKHQLRNVDVVNQIVCKVGANRVKAQLRISAERTVSYFFDFCQIVLCTFFGNDFYCLI